MVIALALLVVIIIFFSGGGASTILGMTSFLKSIPSPILVVLGVIILFKIIGGKK